MKQPKLPRRNWLGAGVALLVVLASGTAAAWQVVQLLADHDSTPSASAPATPPRTDDTAARSGSPD